MSIEGHKNGRKRSVWTWLGGLGQSIDEKIENPDRKYLTFQMVEVSLAAEL